MPGYTLLPTTAPQSQDQLTRRQLPRVVTAGFYLVRRSVLYDLGAEVAALNRTEILLIALTIAGVLVEHVRVSCLYLCLHNSVPTTANQHIYSCTRTKY